MDRQYSKFEIQPELVGFYSVDGDQNYLDGISSLKYMTHITGDVEMDLTKGQDRAITKNKNNVGNETYFTYMDRHEKLVKEFAHRDVLKAGIITNRSTLRAIANTYDQNMKTFSVTYLRGNIYVSKTVPHVVPEDEFTNSTRWGYKFEQHMLTSTPNGKPNLDEAVNEKDEFVCIFKLNMGKHKLLYRCEIDGILADDKGKALSNDKSEAELIEELKTRTFVELKCTNISVNNKTFSWRNSKSIWMQCIFAGINDIYLGMKDYSGVVHDIKRYTLDDIREFGSRNWRPDGILQTYDCFFDFVKKNIQKKLLERESQRDRTGDVIRFYLTKKYRKDVELSNLPLDQKDDYMPDWYINGGKKRKEEKSEDWTESQIQNY